MQLNLQIFTRTIGPVSWYRMVSLVYTKGYNAVQVLFYQSIFFGKRIEYQVRHKWPSLSASFDKNLQDGRVLAEIYVSQKWEQII